ncbi:MAG TPA: hypothetical protein VMU95_41365 [Trebonia sp.]|nr:hypothetical protein [Trebonia sp.]
MATTQQPVAYIAGSDSSIDNTDQTVYTGATSGPPVVFITETDAVVIEVTCQVA